MRLVGAARAAIGAMLCATCGLAASPASAVVRALFVGIDTYQYPGDEFANLSGPVGDVGMIKAALVKAKKLDLDPVGLDPNAAGCHGQNETSITLVESCATYADVTGALATQIAASQPGDIVLFFFAGHGSTYSDATHEQSTGSNDTILPYDAHKPNEMTEILDRELRRTIDGAVARGVSVVTIFDSCHSGTGTRELAGARSREAKPGPYVPLSPARLAAMAAPGPNVTAPPEVRAYRIHFAAAADTELANEYRYEDGWHGAFSRALAQAILARPDASYGDLIVAARATLDPQAVNTQHPQAEGALAATFLGPDPGPMRLYAATRDRKTVVLAGGMLSGVSEGSTFTLHRDITGAAANQVLATATVSEVGVDQAVLTVDRHAPDLPGTLEAREANHRYGTGELRVGLHFDARADKARAATALRSLELVTQVDRRPDLVIAGAKGEAALCAPDGRLLKSAGRIDDVQFAARIADALRIVARYKEMLALSNDQGAARADMTVDRNCDDVSPAECASLHSVNGVPLFAPGNKFRVTVQSKLPRDQYLYLFDLEPDRFSVTPLTPPGARDVVTRRHPMVQYTGTAGVAGDAQLLLLATDAYIDLSALAQDGLARDIDPLARLLQAASSGTRAIDPPAVGNWGGMLVSLRVADPHPSAKESSPCDILSSL